MIDVWLEVIIGDAILKILKNGIIGIVRYLSNILEHTKVYKLSILSILMKSILLKFDKNFFYKMKKDKQRREYELTKLISWEDYIKILFGFNQNTERGIKK